MDPSTPSRQEPRRPCLEAAVVRARVAPRLDRRSSSGYGLDRAERSRGSRNGLD